MAISFGVHIGLWSAMVKNGDGPQKVSDLAKQLGLQEELLQRMMRHVAASGYLDMKAPDEYTPNISASLCLFRSCPVAIAPGETTAKIDLRPETDRCFISPPTLNPIFVHAHDWLKDRGYKNLRDNKDTAY